MGATDYSGVASQAGVVFVVQGPVTAGAPDDMAAGSLLGESPGGFFGTQVTGGVDLDDDGHPDVAVHEPYADDPAVYLFLGPLEGARLASGAMARIEGTPTSGGLGPGSAATLVPDMDGDSYGELLVHAPRYADGLDQAAVYIIEGSGI